MTSIYYNVYDAQGNERASFLVGSDEAGDELTAEREARREAARLAARFDGDFRVERTSVED